MRMRSSERSTASEERLIDQVSQISRNLQRMADLDVLIERVGDARLVLIGEASHGTSEFYVWRALLSQRLIQEKDFSFVAVEGDWPDCYEINRYVKGYPDSPNKASQVLQAFSRWPTWMWANWEVDAFAEWLRSSNQARPDTEKVGFYGLDVYSLWESMELALDYLRQNEPESVETAIQAYRCFEPFGEDPQAYARQVAFVPETCENEVIQLLQELRGKVRRFDDDHEAAFNAEQNAFVLLNAERYYRTMIQGGANSWNIRDIHMADTLDRLMRYHGDHTKGIVWAHNTHIGDARATDMVEVGMVNLGELARQRWGNDQVALVGFGSYRGSVVAGQSWGAAMQVMNVPRARTGSWEDIFHRAGGQNRLLLSGDMTVFDDVYEMRGHRAIGVVYDPQSDHYNNYVPSVLPRRYDAFLFVDDSTALAAMHMAAEGADQPPALYPWGL
jgi:erythromycin esterase